MLSGKTGVGTTVGEGGNKNAQRISPYGFSIATVNTFAFTAAMDTQQGVIPESDPDLVITADRPAFSSLSNLSFRHRFSYSKNCPQLATRHISYHVGPHLHISSHPHAH